MTIGYLIDHTLIESLFDKTHENHEQALSLVYFLDQKQLYITFSELVKIMDFCKEYDDKTKKEMFQLITEITTVLNIYENDNVVRLRFLSLCKNVTRHIYKTNNRSCGINLGISRFVTIKHGQNNTFPTTKQNHTTKQQNTKITKKTIQKNKLDSKNYNKIKKKIAQT